MAIRLSKSCKIDPGSVPPAILARAQAKVGLVFGYNAGRRILGIDYWIKVPWKDANRFCPYFKVECLKCGHKDCLSSLSLNKSMREQARCRKCSLLIRNKARRSVDKQGYVRLWAPGHPMARSDGYILEHRLVASINGKAPG